MFVSILNLMGFGLGKPIQSRAGETPENKPAKVNNKGITQVIEDHRPQGTSGQAAGHESHAQADSVRRQEVKAQSRTPKAPAEARKPAPKAKAVGKVNAKPAVKAKPAVTQVASKGVKAGAKTTRPVAKAAAKPATRPVSQAVAKPVAKAAAKAATPKPAAKVAAPVVKPGITKAAMPVPSKAASSAKPAVQAAKKAPAQPAPASLKAVPAASAPVPKAVRGSRLAQLTVPSMAQAVASTAAKSSYTQTMTAPVFAPPPHVAVKKDPKLANNWKTKTADQLTDAEVLAMPDSEYMNDKQMAFFRLKLSQLKQDILNSAGETTEHLREDTVVVPDPADRATIEEEHALELRTRDRERKLLKKIEQSIQRIDAGDYGYCDETGEPIGVGRLLARPTATLSLEAQQRRELKQKMFGD